MDSPELSHAPILQQADSLELVFRHTSGRKTVPALPAAQTLAALQQVFTSIAGTDDPVLGDLLVLPERERQSLLRLEILEARIASLHLHIGPDYNRTRNQRPESIDSVRGAFTSIARAVIVDAQEIQRGNVAHHVGDPNRNALRSIGKALAPDRLSLSLGLPGIISCTLEYDFSKRVRKHEEAQREPQRATLWDAETATLTDAGDLTSPSIPAPRRASGKLVGPYKGVITDIDMIARTFTFQCDDYTAKTPCHCDSDMQGTIAKLREGQEVTLWGQPVREPGARLDKPPLELAHVDISLHW